MKTIVCKFKSNGQDVVKRAILNDSLTEISGSKKNEATDIDYFTQEEGTWAVIFEVSDTLMYEAVLEYDCDNNRKTLNPIKAITWEGGTDAVITDVQQMTVNSR